MSTIAKAVRSDKGVVIKIDFLQNMTGSTDLSFQVEYPTGRIEIWTPVIINGNFLEYTTTTGDLPEVGTYRVSPQVTKGSFSGRGKPVSFDVIDKFAVSR